MSKQIKAFINARLLDPASRLDSLGSLIVTDRVITEFGSKISIPKNAETIDCQGNCLAPGLIDMRAFLGEPGYEHKETFSTAGEAAAAGGITTLIGQPQTDPIVDEPAVVGYIARSARTNSKVKVYTMAAITKGLQGKEMTEMGLLSQSGAVAFTDGDIAVADTRVMFRALSYASTWDLLIVQHSEDPSLARGGVMNSGEMSTRLGLAGIPGAAEVMMVERDIRLAELTGCRYHAASISTAKTTDSIRRAKENEIKLSCAVAAHNFSLNELEIGEYRTFAKTTPPLRSEEDRVAMVEALADGTIDVIVSNHSPQDQESKRQPFAAAEAGIAALQTLLPLSLELVHRGHISLLDLLSKLTVNPAKLLGLPSGELKIGRKADLIIFNLDLPWRLSESDLLSKSKNTPYDGRPVQGKVLQTIVAGDTVFKLKE